MLLYTSGQFLTSSVLKALRCMISPFRHAEAAEDPIFQTTGLEPCYGGSVACSACEAGSFGIVTVAKPCFTDVLLLFDWL